MQRSQSSLKGMGHVPGATGVGTGKDTGTGTVGVGVGRGCNKKSQKFMPKEHFVRLEYVGMSTQLNTDISLPFHVELYPIWTLA
jgi:hypothetical protein